MGPRDLPVISEAEVLSLLSPLEAVDLLEAALASGIDAARDPNRSSFDTGHGQMLLMPSEVGDRAGIKVLTVTPENADTGFPHPNHFQIGSG